MIEWMFATGALLLLAVPQESVSRIPAPVELPAVRIWDEAPHSAFVDLIRFRDRFYCAFREGSGHVPGDSGTDGTVRVIASADGVKWTSVASIAEEGVDLRDPKLSVTPDGRILIVIGGSVYDGRTLQGRLPRASLSNEEGTEFSRAESLEIDPKIAGPEDWLWRVTWHEGTAWGVMYQPGSDRWGLQLMKSADGLGWEHAHAFELDGKPNECTIRFLLDGRMAIVARREGGDHQGVIGVAPAPYTEWTWREIGVRLGGPNFVRLADGSLILGTRHYGENRRYRTILGRLGLDGSFERLVDLPSGGDTSYPGLVVHEEELWVAYYSSHEEKTAIYLARVPLKLLAADPEESR